MKTNENHITIKLEGFSCSPEEITEKIGLQPTRTAIKNQEYQTGSPQNRITKKYKNNYWEFRVVTNETTWISDLARQFLEDNVRPRIDQIKHIVSGCEGELSIVQYVNEGCNPGLHFEKEEIELLSQIGFELDIDIYCLAEEK